MNLQHTYKFNRFPILKDRFFALIEKLCKSSTEFSSLFTPEPRAYDKVFITMTDNELELLGRRVGIPNILKEFKTNDGVLSYSSRVIILHVPAMIRNTSPIPTSPIDPNRRILFTVHFFASLFHELAHSCDTIRIALDKMCSTFGDAEPAAVDSVTTERLEEVADEGEKISMGLLAEYLEKNKMSWPELSEHLFDWGKLQRHVRI